LDTVDFLAGPNPSWDTNSMEGENLTTTTSSGSAHNENTDATTNKKDDKKSSSGLFSSFSGSGSGHGRTKKKNAHIRSTGHKIRPAWYPKSLIRKDTINMFVGVNVVVVLVVNVVVVKKKKKKKPIRFLNPAMIMLTIY
jgi:hypothetical protein